MAADKIFNTDVEETLKGADIKLLLIDFDGTLFVDKDIKVPEENIEAIKLAIEKGYMVSVCTGRSKVGILSAFGEENLKKMNFYGMPGVYINGTIVYDQIGYTLLDETIETDVYAELIRYLVQNNLVNQTIFYRGESNYVTEDNKYADFMQKMYSENRSIIIRQNEILKYRTMNKLMIVLDPSESKIVIENLKRNFGKKLTIFTTYNGHAEVTKLGHDKYTGISYLLKHYNISDDQVLVVGDAENDIAMLSNFKYSFAVANATESAKSFAKCVIPLTHKEGAVAYLLKKVFELKKN
ncbi:haloacid dehalogenase-like hydrolase, putative [Plasmodium gallinaceum]|uniref:Haloacid dehalogenase-like hydrolase, putative n=1 Tax=Plasmodium gallinaceum TaxID=5849 RepID=A0A1J1GQK6_PLAGA|nr:haloacid dehalogenase-like hydrolase, putative [Plasmodium gallinaceum]CRG93567.1 haloacid dehalogenase-like hydrolase, putative [Plasmodium gallinaceum]